MSCEEKTKSTSPGRFEFWFGVCGSLVLQVVVFYGRVVALETNDANQDKRIEEVRTQFLDEVRQLRQEVKGKSS